MSLVGGLLCFIALVPTFSGVSIEVCRRTSANVVTRLCMRVVYVRRRVGGGGVELGGVRVRYLQSGNVNR